MILGVFGIEAVGLAERVDRTFGISGSAQEDGEIVVKWRGIRVPFDGLAHLADRGGVVAAEHRELGELHAAGGLVGIEIEHVDQLAAGAGFIGHSATPSRTPKPELRIPVSHDGRRNVTIRCVAGSALFTVGSSVLSVSFGVPTPDHASMICVGPSRLSSFFDFITSRSDESSRQTSAE